MTTEAGTGFGERLKAGRDEAQELREEVAALASEIRGLAAAEVALARAEMKEQATAAVRGVIWAVVAAVVAWFAAMWIAMSLMLALDTMLPLWAASLITLAVLAVLGGITGMVARSKLRSVTMKPEKTTRAVREDIEWAKDRLKSRATSSAAGMQ